MARFNPLRWIAGFLLNHWGSKITALFLASLFFIVMREDVTREFIIPLHVIEDDQRALRTKLPETVTVEVHGSWSRINRLSASDLGSLDLDLKKLKEGKLVIDESTLEMPSGVILRDLIYDGVDVRFDPIINREFPVKPVVQVEVHEDYEYIGMKTNPPRVKLRGAKSIIQEISSLGTEPEELKNLSSNTTIVKGVLRPREGVDFVGMAKGERPEVTIEITIRPKAGERKFEVPIATPVDLLPEELRAGVPMPETYPVTVRGPIPDLRKLDSFKDPVEATVRFEDQATDGDGPGTVIIDFTFIRTVPPGLTAGLSLHPSRKLLPVPRDPARTPRPPTAPGRAPKP